MKALILVVFAAALDTVKSGPALLDPTKLFLNGQFGMHSLTPPPTKVAIFLHLFYTPQSFHFHSAGQYIKFIKYTKHLYRILHSKLVAQ